jgi:hypothetical protein
MEKHRVAGPAKGVNKIETTSVVCPTKQTSTISDYNMARRLNDNYYSPF